MLFNAQQTVFKVRYLAGSNEHYESGIDDAVHKCHNEDAHTGSVLAVTVFELSRRALATG